MLSDKEQELLNNIGRIMNGFSEIQEQFFKEFPGKFEKYDGDNTELCMYIHQLQNWVLSNSAARSHPEKFRPFGLIFKKDNTVKE